MDGRVGGGDAGGDGVVLRRLDRHLWAAVRDGYTFGTIEQGSRYVAIDADAEVLGEQPLRVGVPRDLPRGVPDAVMSFGDGNHRCPGNAVALLESDVFLTRLLACDLVVVSPPELTWNSLIESYELRGFLVRRSGG